MKKFGGWLDEDENVMVGGTTLCECCTYCLKCKKNPNGRLREKAEADAEDGDGEFAADEFEGDKAGAKNKGKVAKRGCCTVCCRAIFCCDSGNTVSREIEMADLRQNLGSGD